MRYGKQVLVHAGADAVTRHEFTQYVDYKTIKSYTVNTETVRVKDYKDILAEFLNLLDRQKSGEIHDIGIQCIASPSGDVTRIEKSWVTKDLQ